MSVKYVARFGTNVSGKDFCVGDIHGCFSKLGQALERLGFDNSRDRLFSVGDLVDRGPESERVLEWLEKPWFHPVQGNHEDLAIRFVDPGNRDTEHYLLCGGAWMVAASPDDQYRFADAMKALPYMIEVETSAGLVGIVHANIIGNWHTAAAALRSVKSNNQRRAITDLLLWDRDRYNNEDRTNVDGVRAVVVGHTPTRRPCLLGNVYHIDTGGWTRDGSFTFINLQTLDTIPASPAKLEWVD